MRKQIATLLIIIVIITNLVGCSKEKDYSVSDTSATEAETSTSSDTSNAKYVINDKEGFEDCETVITNILESEKSYEFSLASQYYWEDSYRTFLVDYSKLYNPDHYNIENFELVEYEFGDYTEIPNNFNLEVREYVVDMKFYWHGKLEEGRYSFIMVFVPEQGWKKSYKGYLGSADTGFKESRVIYNTTDEYDENALASKVIKFAPRETIYTYYSTYVSIDLLTDFSNIGEISFFSSPNKSPKVNTMIVLKDENTSYSGVMRYSQASIGSSHNATLENTSMIVDLGVISEEIILPEEIYIKDYVLKDINRFLLYDINIMENGEFLNIQQSVMNHSYKYNEEIFIPEKSDEVLNGQLSEIIQSNNSINTTGNKNNLGLAVIKDGWIYTNENHTFIKKNISTKETVQINTDDVSNLNLCGEYIYYINRSDSYDSIYRYHTINGTREKLTKNLQMDRIQIIDNYIYYQSEFNIGRIDINLQGVFEPIVAGNIHYFNIQDDYAYYVLKGDDYTENDKICRTKVGDEERKKEVLHEVIYNVKPFIDDLEDILVDENYMFFVDRDSFGTIYRMNHDGSEITDLVDASDYVTRMNMDEEYIYYTIENSYLFKVRKDGTSLTNLIKNENVFKIYLCDEYLCYYDDRYGDLKNMTSIKK